MIYNGQYYRINIAPRATKYSASSAYIALFHQFRMPRTAIEADIYVGRLENAQPAIRRR